MFQKAGRSLKKVWIGIVDCAAELVAIQSILADENQVRPVQDESVILHCCKASNRLVTNYRSRRIQILDCINPISTSQLAVIRHEDGHKPKSRYGDCNT